MSVAIVMGSESDYPTMEPAVATLHEFGIVPEVRVVSAHRSPEAMIEFGKTAADRGIQVIVAAAGGAAHLPGMLASVTRLPVVGVPVPATKLDGMDALLSIAQMPAGVPVATMAIGGAANAALMALRILGLSDPEIAGRLDDHRMSLVEKAKGQDAALQERVVGSE